MAWPAPDQFHCAEPATAELLTLAHDPHYVDAYLTGTIDARAMRRIGFPWDARLVRRTCTALAGTLLAAELALEHGLACSTAGGTHHAYYDFGSGYCIFNDLAVAARALLRQGRVQRVLIVDLDVHQGDGTASILQARSCRLYLLHALRGQFPISQAGQRPGCGAAHRHGR